MVVNATFNNISTISWQSVLLVEEPEVLEKTTDLSQITTKVIIEGCIEYTSLDQDSNSRRLW